MLFYFYCKAILQQLIYRLTILSLRLIKVNAGKKQYAKAVHLQGYFL